MELQTGFNTGNIRVESRDGSLYVGADRLTIEPWTTQDGVSMVTLWRNGVLSTTINMETHVAHRFGVECEHGGVDVEGI